ncbi:MAG: hypothetical protein O3B75_03100 [Planctomycetota bacterium]|nr:hypothetical protein [Planctomycetota bacterium]
MLTKRFIIVASCSLLTTSFAFGFQAAPAVIPVGNYSSLLDLNRRFSHPSARRVLLQPLVAAEKPAPKIVVPEGKAGA